MPMVMHLACILCGMNMAEAFNAATINAAYSIGNTFSQLYELYNMINFKAWQMIEAALQLENVLIWWFLMRQAGSISSISLVISKTLLKQQSLMV